MRRFLALTRKEIGGLLLSPPILFATAFFVLLNSFAFYLTIAREVVALAIFDDIALFMLFSSIIMFPLVSMHSFSEENATGTMETLLTAPIGNLTAVLAKYTGAMAFAVLYLAHGLVYAMLLAYGGNLDWNSTITAFLALVAVGSLAMSLGVFVSSLTRSPVAAAAGTGGILIFMAVAADLDPYSGTLSDILHSISFMPHAKRWIAGQIDTRGLVYFLSGTALFLFYAWLTIGSRKLDKKSADPTVRRRLTVTYVLVSAGFIMLLIQVAVLHVNGFWESGMPFGTTGMARIPGRWFLPILLSVTGFVWSIFTYRAARRAERRTEPPKNFKYVTMTDSQVMKAPRYYYEENLRARRRVTLAALAALIIVLNINWLSHYPFRTFADGRLRFLTMLQERSWDVSQDGRNSLSATTQRALDSLQGRVQIYSFFTEGLQAHDVPVAEETRRLLDRYTDHNAQVSITFADALREPELAGRLAVELELKPENLAELLVIDYQGRRMTLAAATLAVPPDWRRQAAGDNRWIFDGENRITQAIMHLADPRVPNVFFTYGHMEHSLAGRGFPERTASRLVRAMAGANMRVRQHSVAFGGEIPADCDVLVIAAPRLAFREDEVAEITRYLDRGGRLLVLAPVAGPETKAEEDPLNQFLFDIGGSYRDDIMEDRQNNDNRQFLAPMGKTKGSVEGSVDMVFPFTRTIRDNPRSVENGWTCERLIESYPASVAASLINGEMRPGPFTLIYRSAKSTDVREARVVVVASGRMAADSDITRGANEALIMAMTQWLAGREETRDTPPRSWIDRRLALTGPQLRAVLWIGVVGLPLVWLIAGISVWLVRRD